MPSATKEKDSTILKIAVEMLNAPDKVPQLIEFDQSQPLSSIIQLLCKPWGLPDPENYALQFSESINQNYITEKNRNEIKNGSVLRLELSPARTVQDILGKINSGSETEQIAALTKLSVLSTDLTFALEFINKKGLTLILNNIENGKFKAKSLKYALVTFVELMDHGIIFWDILENQFINKVASFVSNQANAQDPMVIQSCLSILENIVLNSSKNSHVEKEITIPNLISHLQNSHKDSKIQQNTIALINAIFSKADFNKRKAIAATLFSKQVRNVIYEYLIAGESRTGTELAHQLYVLQTLLLGLLEPKMRQRADSQEQESQDRIKELRKIAFENDNNPNLEVTMRRPVGSYSKDFKKLGFKCEIDPIKDFNETPPGLLALDCMLYFARNYPEHYTKIVLENSCRADEHECPFGKTSVELVKQLCDIMHIGDAPSEQGQTYHPLFFTHDHPFEELFCICIVLLNKTWKEMRATIEDFVKVSSVVREQISRALLSSPKGFDKFRQKINELSYAEITQIWLQERTNREVCETHARPIVELKEKITPEIIDLIQLQRLGVLVGGTRFKKYSTRGQRIKDKFWFVRLSPNHKVLHYGDCDEKSTPSLEELGNKLAVTEIKCVITGKDCPHMKDLRGRKTTPHLAFSLIPKSAEVVSLDFVAPDEQVFDYWTDGVNALLKEKMTSKSFANDLQTLLSMDIKVRLLDAEGIDIPQDPPQIPEEPEDYDFYYDNI